jgi:serine/threonine protein kinase
MRRVFIYRVIFQPPHPVSLLCEILHVISMMQMHSTATPSHPNGQLFLVFEFVEQDLRRYLDSIDAVDPELVRSYIFQLLRGIAFCHANRVLHRDLVHWLRVLV